MRSLRALWLAGLTTLTWACSKSPPADTDAGPTPPPYDAGPVVVPDAGPALPPWRCGLDLTPYLADTGTGASLHQITQASDLLPGVSAQAKVGDWRLQNDQVIAIVQGPDRHIGPQPFGGNIIDAALVGPDAHDEFGEVGLLYNFGRTVDAQHFEVLADGAQGGSAVLAASGEDALNDWLGIKNQLHAQLGKGPAVDPDVALPLRITHYYVLSPGQKRVRYLTALCNDGDADVVLAAGDLTDPGGSVEFFNPDACIHGFGYSQGTCFGLDPLSWFGYQGTGVAYGYAANQTSNPMQPEELSAVLTVAGVTGSILSAPGLDGLLKWFDDTVTHRAGELLIPGHQSKYISRDFVIGRDLGDVASTIEQSRSQQENRATVPLSGTVRDPAGAPVPGARVTLERANTTLGVEAVFVTDSSGQYKGQLFGGAYQISAWANGRVPTAKTAVTLSRTPVVQDLTLGATRTLTVHVQAVDGSALPAKVSLLCVGPCPAPSRALDLYTDTSRDPFPSDVQLIGFVPPAGTAAFQVPPGHYQLVVSRGPTYAVWPPSWPGSGHATDLSTADATVTATLAKVIDTSGWLGADFHVHGVNSPDSYVGDVERVLSFLGEGDEVLVSTDHDYVTDLAPANLALGGQSLLTTVIGEEASPMDFGHYILFPFPHDASQLNGGALDWAGGTGPTFTLGQLFHAARQQGAQTIQFNHPRGSLGGFSYLRVDMDTLATHSAALDFRMAPDRTSTTDTGLMGSDFNALELLNPGLDSFDPSNAYGLFNDWFTLLSQGMKVTGTGVSDTHQRFATAAGYWRTYVHVGTDKPQEMAPAQLSAAVNAQQAFGTNGPFVLFHAHRVNPDGSAGADVESGGVLGGTGNVELVVDVQVPESMDITKIELYTHLPTDDASCPIQLDDPNANTTRVGCNGMSANRWPNTSVLASHTVVLGANERQLVATVDGQPVRRYHHVETFVVPAPTADNWFVAMVYGSTDLFPLVYSGVSSSGARNPAKPFAFTNPIYVDADGAGFDHPPFHPLRPSRPHVPPPPPAPARPVKVSAKDMLELIRQAQHH